MCQRMLNKQQKPTFEEMQQYCGETGEMFSSLNKWLSDAFQTEKK